MRFRNVAGLTLVVFVVLLSACGSPEQPNSTATPMSWSEQLVEVRVLAEDSGAGAEQLAILERGEITFAEYQAAVGRTVACMREAGIEVIGDRVTSSRGFPEINYSYSVTSPGRSEAATDEISQECIVEHSMYVDGMYRASPAVIEVLDARFEPHRVPIIDCLRSHEVAVEDDAPRHVLERLVLQLQYETGEDCFVGYVP